MADETRHITDPKALRAVAHPLRWQLLEILAREGTATATQCAQETGESVANCSYHLNLLARYDYVEKAEGGQGREKPWRLVTDRQQFGVEGSPDEETKLAAQAASIAFLDYQFALVKDRHLRLSTLPAEWHGVSGIDNTQEFMTPAEVTEFREEVRKLMDRFRDRRTDPAKRPEGARSVNLFFSSMVKPD